MQFLFSIFVNAQEFGKNPKNCRKEMQRFVIKRELRIEFNFSTIFLNKTWQQRPYFYKINNSSFFNQQATMTPISVKVLAKLFYLICLLFLLHRRQLTEKSHPGKKDILVGRNMPKRKKKKVIKLLLLNNSQTGTKSNPSLQYYPQVLIKKTKALENIQKPCLYL